MERETFVVRGFAAQCFCRKILRKTRGTAWRKIALAICYVLFSGEQYDFIFTFVVEYIT
jgi:hypothetical protein